MTAAQIALAVCKPGRVSILDLRERLDYGPMSEST